MNWKTRTLSILLASVLVGCSASPTGRNQILLFSDSQMNTLGAQSFEEMKKSQAVNNDPRINKYVQCVSDAVTQNVTKTGFSEWEIVVFDSDQINAFALPGGKIGVYTGLLKTAKTADQLATVIGHEIAHVIASHGNERMSQTSLASTGLQISSLVIGTSQYSQYHNVAMAALGVGVQVGVVLPYGRSQESEADIIGLELMAKSGFDPNASVQLWKNMSAASNGQQQPELLSTHPSHSTRINDLNDKIRTLPASQVTKPNCGTIQI
ncbi:M48 family metallopeptidase [Vibrio sp. WJH972]